MRVLYQTFIIRHKISNKKCVEIDKFTDFFELDDFFKLYNYTVNEENLIKLKKELSPIVKQLLKVPEKEIIKYDTISYYPNKCKLDSDKLKDSKFNPLNSDSLFPAKKVLQLYYSVSVMIKYLQLHPEHYIDYKTETGYSL